MLSMIIGVVQLLKYFAPYLNSVFGVYVMNICFGMVQLLVYGSQPHIASILGCSRYHSFRNRRRREDEITRYKI